MSAAGFASRKMRKLGGFLHTNRFLVIILMAALVFRVLQYSDNAVWWDSSVYIGMGKYIFSNGTVGLWEDVRPLVLPLILGFFWKLGLDPITAGKVLITFFSLGCVAMTYLLGRKIFSETIAVFASFMLAFSPTFFAFDTQILTGIPSLFFSLLGIYFFLDEKYFVSGLWLGMAFMTRFLQLGVFIVLLLFMLCRMHKDRKNSGHETGKDTGAKIWRLTGGLSVLFLPFLAVSYYLYGSPLLSFFRQVFMSNNTGWIYWEPFWYYFINLLKENFLVIFALSGALIIKTQKKQGMYVVLALFLAYLAYFSLIMHKEMRFAITFLPYLYLVTAYGLHEAYVFARNRRIALMIFGLFFVLWAIQTNAQLFKAQPKEQANAFQYYLNRPEVTDGIWVSSPLFLLHSDKKASELMYYPLFNSDKITQLRQKLGEARHVLLNTCDLECPPEDSQCSRLKSDFMSEIRAQLQQVYQENTPNCQYFIYTK
jgi:4-amino-4-deoxy-L-arabinose transferase-like glycosyltransferase